MAKAKDIAKSDKNLNAVLKAIKKLDKDKKVRFAAVYGSYFTGKFNKLSDIDIAIFYDGDKKERFDFRIAMLGELKNRFDIRIFQDLPLYVKEQILKSNRIIFESDSKLTYEIIIKTIRECESFKRHYNLYADNLEGAKIA